MVRSAIANRLIFERFRMLTLVVDGAHFPSIEG
jgi:hypothetical protein